MDVISASPDANKVAWYKNVSGVFEEIVISTQCAGVSLIEVGDVDGNSLLDVVGASNSGGTLFWFRQVSPRSWLTYKISSSVNAIVSIAIGDVDRFVLAVSQHVNALCMRSRCSG